jgi:hypothetical protein
MLVAIYILACEILVAIYILAIYILAHEILVAIYILVICERYLHPSL